MRFSSIFSAAAFATLVRADATSKYSHFGPCIPLVDESCAAVFQTYGACQSDILTTVPLTVAATTTTVTTTLPLTTTVSRYPIAARDAAPTPQVTARAELEERDFTVIYSWVCTGTITQVSLLSSWHIDMAIAKCPSDAHLLLGGHDPGYRDEDGD